MRKSNWSPSIVPRGDDQNVYIVLDDFGRNGRAYRETAPEQADLQAVIMDMLEGQYQKPGSGRRFQYGRALVGRCLRRCRARIAVTLRSSNARRSVFSAGFCRSLRRSLSRRAAPAPDASCVTMAFQRKKPAAIGIKAPLPGFIEPALAGSIEKVPSGERWVHEISLTATACRYISPTKR
jgi:hypothetical protein